MKTIKTLLSTAAILMTSWLSSCNSDINVGLPPGEEGERGHSAYQVWKNSVEEGIVAWPKNEVGVVDFFKFLKGADGKNGINGVDGVNGKSAYEVWKDYIATGDVAHPLYPNVKWNPSQNSLPDFWLFLTGASGQNGQTPIIGANGNWWIGGKDTGKPAKGEKGDMSQAPEVYIGANGNWIINGVDTRVPATGKDGRDGLDGVAPKLTIGANGNWHIDGIDTGKPSRGQAGANGANGIVSNVVVGANGNWWIDGVDTGKPSQGRDGRNTQVSISATGTWIIDGTDTGKPVQGANGTSPTVVIGANGNWYINGVDSNVPARGAKGDAGANGVVPTINIDPATGNWVIDGVLTNTRARAKDGITPAIGISTDGYWVIGGEKTRHFALGLDGKTPNLEVRDGFWYINGQRTSWPSKGDNARQATITISDATGNWVIDGNDTGMPARGPQGDTGAAGTAGPNGVNGQNGLSAYQLWKIEIAKGLTPNPHEDGLPWDPTKNSISDFWYFLRGKDGKDGAPGANGQDGRPGEVIEAGKYNVLAIYYNGANREYVTPVDGSVTYTVVDKLGNTVGAGVVVKGLPGLDPAKTYTTNASGQFTIERNDLPNTGLTNKGSATVIVGGVTETTATNTIVPAQVAVRLTAQYVFLRTLDNNTDLLRVVPAFHRVVVKYKLERNINGKWSEYPGTYPAPTYKAVLVLDPDQPVTSANIREDASTNISIENGLYSTANNYFGFIRPTVFTEVERNAAANPTQSDIKNIWGAYKAKHLHDGVSERYYSMRGLTNVYASDVLLEAAIHVPEIYPMPELKDLRYVVKTGESWLWGKICPANFMPYYTTMTKHVASGVVKYKSTKRPGSDLVNFANGHSKQVFLRVWGTSNLLGNTGVTFINRDMRYHRDTDGGVKFALLKAYPSNHFLTYVYFEDLKGEYTQGTNSGIQGQYYYPYRPNVLGEIKQVGSDYFWQDPYLSTISTQLPIQDVPDATWYAP